MMSYWGFPKYVSVAEKREKAERKLKQLLKKNPEIRPVRIQGKALADSWWGKSWNQNLERYADYENRIGRGRSYLRHGAVLDLQITMGKVQALVQGSHRQPYEVDITITPLPAKRWKAIQTFCTGKLDSLQELLSGGFPKALADSFTAKGQGLFPTPKEIKFDCSCPDWAYMCKHVAAALYGIGARLDEEPGLFFTLRGVDMNDLISQALETKTRELLQPARPDSRNIISDVNLSDIFGIDLESGEEDLIQKLPKPKTKRSGKRRKKRAPKVAAKTAAPPKPKKAGRKPVAASGKKAAEPPIETVAKIIGRRSRNGLTVADIQARTGFEATQIRNAIYRLKSAGRIKNLERGVYVKA